MMPSKARYALDSTPKRLTTSAQTKSAPKRQGKKPATCYMARPI